MSADGKAKQCLERVDDVISSDGSACAQLFDGDLPLQRSTARAGTSAHVSAGMKGNARALCDLSTSIKTLLQYDR